MKVTAQNIIKEFSPIDFQHIILNNTQPQLRYRSHFPLRYNPTLSFGNIERDGDANIMASVVALGAKAPRTGRTFASNVTSSIPKIEQARDLNEQGMFKLRELRDSVTRQIDILRQNPQVNPDGTVSDNTSNLIAQLGATLVQEIYGDAVFVQNTVNNRLEWLAKQVASTGIITLDKLNNSKGVQGLTLNFGIEVVDPAKDWDDETADPVEDLKAARRAGMKSGFNQTTAITDSITMDRILALPQISHFVYGVPINPTGGYRAISPSLAELNVKLASQSLPQFQVWDSFLVEEDKSGAKTSNSGWEQGRIMLSDSGIIGDTRYTHSEAFTSNITGAITSKVVADNMILVQQWGETDPDILSAKATAYAIPVINNTKRKMIMKAFNTGN